MLGSNFEVKGRRTARPRDFPRHLFELRLQTYRGDVAVRLIELPLLKDAL
jgi:hypothetical protein